MYVILEARSQSASADRPEGLAEWNKHGHRDGFIEAPALEGFDADASLAYTLLPPYAPAGLGVADPYKVVCSNGTEYVSVHDLLGIHVTADYLQLAPKGRRRIPPNWNLSAHGDGGFPFVTFEGGLYRRYAPFYLEAKPHFTDIGDPVLDVTVKLHNYDRGGVFTFLPRQAHVLERIASSLCLPVRTGSVETAVGLKVHRPLGPEANPPKIQEYVSSGMGLPVWRLNSRGLRALADLRATHEEIHGGSTRAPLADLLDLMEGLTGMNDPDNPVGPYEGDGWRFAAEESRYDDDRHATFAEGTEALQRRFVIERVRVAVLVEKFGPAVLGNPDE